MVNRCPSCARNLRLVFCSMTCDPHQSRFLSPNATIQHTIEHEDHSHTNVTLITALNYIVRDSYIQGMYESCSEVTNPSSNSLAITNFCGSWGEDCNAHRFVYSVFLLICVVYTEFMILYRNIDFSIPWV